MSWKGPNTTLLGGKINNSGCYRSVAAQQLKDELPLMPGVLAASISRLVFVQAHHGSASDPLNSNFHLLYAPFIVLSSSNALQHTTAVTLQIRRFRCLSSSWLQAYLPCRLISPGLPR